MAKRKYTYVVELWFDNLNKIYEVHGPFTSKTSASVWVGKWFDRHGSRMRGHLITYEIKRGNVMG